MELNTKRKTMTKRKDGRWQQSLTVDGKKIFFYSSATTERQAQKDINQQILNYQEQQAYHPFNKVADAWYDEYCTEHNESTIRNSLNGTYNRVVRHFNDVPIEDITPHDISAFISILVAKKYSKKTISNHKSVLNMIMRYAVLQGYIKYNPVPEIKLPNNLPKKARELPKDEEIQIISQHWDGFDLFAYMLLYTGLRRSEALALNYEDIYNGTIHVNKAARFIGNKLVVEERTKTKSSEREILVLDALANKIPKGKGRIFADITSKKRFVTEWNNYTSRYGITLTPHQLRHAYATMLYEAGIDEKAAQQLMGHSDISLTREIYTHLRDKKMDDVKNKLNQFKW